MPAGKRAAGFPGGFQLSRTFSRQWPGALMGCFWLLLCLPPAKFSQAKNPEGLVRLSFVKGRVSPGDILRIDVSASQDIARIDLSFLGQQLKASPRESSRRWQALLGVDLETRHGPYVVSGSVTLANGQSVELKRSIQVLPKRFPTQRITVDEKFVTLSPEDAKRAEEESQRLEAIWEMASPEKLWRGQFLSPVNSILTSGFGRRRIVNNQPRSPHSGVDLKAATGTPIRAANGGRVVLAGELFFSGNTVVLDHGLGLYTYYAHCSKVFVKEGETVKRGQTIAEVGATGRVTGPHLHWACRLNGARVNPLELTQSWLAE